MTEKSIVAAALIAMAGSTAALADDPMKIAQEVAAQWTALYNQKAADKFAATFMTDGVYITMLGTIKGRGAIQAVLEARFKEGWATSEIDVQGAWGTSDVVWDYGTYRLSGANDKGPMSERGEWSAVLVKDPTGWHAVVVSSVLQTPLPSSNSTSSTASGSASEPVREHLD